MQTSCNFTKTSQMLIGDFYTCLKDIIRRQMEKRVEYYTTVNLCVLFLTLNSFVFTFLLSFAQAVWLACDSQKYLDLGKNCGLGWNKSAHDREPSHYCCITCIKGLVPEIHKSLRHPQLCHWIIIFIALIYGISILYILTLLIIGKYCLLVIIVLVKNIF